MSTDSLVTLIDEEIARLKQVRQLIAGTTAAVSSSDPKPAKPGRKRRRLSVAARKKIADAQRLRWAKQKRAAQKDMADGTIGRQTVGATMDYEIIYALLHATMDASHILGLDAPYRAQIDGALKRIPHLKIGKHGQLQEWSEDYDEPTPGMSHVSHLFALFPSDEITLRGTPELANAARISLERREENGGGRGGWPSAWYANLWARLDDGDRASKHIQDLLATSAESLLNANRRWFQIDANFGGASAIAEMLLQSHSGEIEFLPALPSAWSEGHFRGLKARGDVEVDASWQANKALSAALRPAVAGEFKLRPPHGQRIAKVETGGHTVAITEVNGDWHVRLEPHKEYMITFE